MIKKEIVDAYYEYREQVIRRYENPKYLQVVIIISPKGMAELLQEERFIEVDVKAEIHYTSMFGRKTPIIIRHDLPENTEFVIQSQVEYERQEKEKLLDKFYKMFGD